MASRSAVMVGREAELLLLCEAFERARAGTPQVAVVTGEAGIGKTRLVREFLERLPDETVVAWGHAVPLAGEELPYGVSGDLLRSLVRQVQPEVVRELLGTRARALARLVPQLGDEENRPVDRPALFTATQDLLAEVSVAMTSVLVVEDAHWADASSTDLIRFLARTATRGSSLLVVTSREVETEGPIDILGDLRRLPHATSVRLTPLVDEALESHIRLLDATLPRSRVAEIRRLSEGIPLYVEELVAGQQRAVSSVAADLSARLRSLPEDAAGLLRLAALQHGPFTAAALASVSQAKGGEIASAIDVGASVQLLERVDGAWQFHHELLRLAAVESMPPSTRESGHRAWANHLKGSSRATDLISAADHLQALGASSAALEARMAAAQAVWNLGTSIEAANQWRTALVLVRELPRAESERDHDHILGALSCAGGSWVDVRDVVLRDAVPAETGSLRELYYQLVRYPASVWSLGVPVPAPTLEEFRHGLDRLRAEPPSLLAYVTGMALLHGLTMEERFDELFEAIRVVAEIARPLPDRYTNARVALAEFRLSGMVGAGHETDRRELVEENVRDSVGRDVHSQVWAHTTASEELIRQGDFAGALAHVRACDELIPSPEADRLSFIATEHASHAALMTGEWDEVLRLAAAPFADSAYFYLWCRRWRAGLVQAWRGEESCVSTAADLRVDTRRVDPELHDFSETIEAAFLSAREPARARGLVAWHLSHLDGTMLFDPRNGPEFGEVWVLAAELAWRDPTSDEDYRTQVQRGAHDAAQHTVLGVTWTLEVDAHLARASGTDFSATWERAVAGWDDLGTPYHSARCRLRWAEVLLGDGGRAQAAELLDGALTTAETLRARTLEDEIRGLAGRARLRLSSHAQTTTGTGPLTAREHEVLQLLVQGMTNDQIGSALFVSPRTASVHVSHILSKLGASNRTEVATIAHRHGLIA